MLLLFVSYNMWLYILFICLLCATVQYCNKIIIFYATDIFIVMLLQFFLDFMIIFKNVVAKLTCKYFTLILL